jgi:predicted dehydrogenase
MSEPVRIGMVGAGFAANVHCRACRRMPESEAQIVAVASRHKARAKELADAYHIGAVEARFEDLIARADIDMVDLCVPNQLHEPFAVAAAKAGKHIIIEKPLTGYFGGEGAADPVGATGKRIMLREAVASAQRIVEAGRLHGVKIGYAENWVYSPGIQRVMELIRTSRGAVLELRAEESHSGSHAPYASEWRLAGGGALLRIASHPICAVLYLKQQEGLCRKGEPIRLRSVMAEVGDVTRVSAFEGVDQKWLRTGWVDVENWATAIFTFDDGTHATVFGSDIVLGGMVSKLEAYLSNSRIVCDLTHSNVVQAFAPDAAVFRDSYFAEKLESKAGWSFPSVDEDWLLGYPQEMRDFVGAVAEERAPISDADLGLEVVRAVYAGYVSAEEGKRVELR